MVSPGRYPIPDGVFRAETLVKGSRFIATAAVADTVTGAKGFIETVRAEFADATHNCWAYVVGPPGSVFQNGSSDDGEPGGTAGRPMLTALLSSGVGDIVVVVTRYFGGVKLGRNGLVRAYGGSVHNLLRDLPLTEHVEFVHVRITVDYAAVEAVRRAISTYGGNVDEESFGETARFDLRVPEEFFDDFEDFVLDATSGRARIEVTGGA